MPSIDATTFLGALPLITEPMRLSRGKLGVLDAGSLQAITGYFNAPEQLEELGYEPGGIISGYYSMWVDMIEETDESDLIKSHRIQCIGLSKNEDKRRRTISAFGRVVAVGPIEKIIIVTNDQETAEDPETDTETDPVRRLPKLDDDGEVEYKTISTPSGLAKRWNINEPIVQVSDRYFTTTEPDTSQIGTAQTPTDAPTPPAYIWGSYNEPLRLNHPFGWVLDNRESIELFRSGALGLWEVSDAFSYYQTAQPD